MQASRWRQRLIRQLTGKLTTHRLALIDQAAITKQSLDFVNVWLLKYADPAQATDKRMTVPLRVLKERHVLIHEFARLLDRIGGVTNTKGHTKPVNDDGLAALDAIRREYAAE
jgi:hypothetical protein